MQPSGYEHRTRRPDSRGDRGFATRGLTRAAAWSLLALAATLAAPAYAQTTLWSATLTVAQDSGFPRHLGYSASRNHGSITDRAFDLGSNSYTILYFVEGHTCPLTDTTNQRVKFALTTFPTESDFTGKILRIGESHSLSV